MEIIGELINASRKNVRKAIIERDESYIRSLSILQVKAGADFIDVNAGVFYDGEAEHLCWLVEVVQSAVDKPCCLDSPHPDVIAAAMKVHRGQAMVNSITLEKDRYEKIVHLVAGSGCKVVALCMSDDGVPVTVEQRLEVAGRLVDRLVKDNVDLSDIYVDPLAQSLAANTFHGREFLGAVRRIKAEIDSVSTICGLSNLSYGLPGRRLLNRTLVGLALTAGLDAAILDPTDKNLMAALKAAQTIIGDDEYCMGYITAFRLGLLDGECS